MKLYNYLMELGNTIVSIGTKMGNGYVYIGPANNIDEINRIFKMHEPTLYIIINGKLSKAEEILKNAKYNYYNNKNLQLKYKSFDKYKIPLIKSVEKYNNMLDDCINRVGIFVNWKDREVLDVYDRNMEDGISIIIEGCECNRTVWSMKEYDKKIKL